jgi:hypothetical protein
MEVRGIPVFNMALFGQPTIYGTQRLTSNVTELRERFGMEVMSKSVIRRLEAQRGTTDEQGTADSDKQSGRDEV